MKSTIQPLRTLAALGFVAVIMNGPAAQVITDDFTNPANWGAPLAFSPQSDMSVANGRMNYTCTSTAEGGAAIARKTPLLPTTRDWSLKVDVHVDPFTVSSEDQFTDVFLGFGKTGDWVDTHVMFEFDRGGWRNFNDFDIGDDVRVNGVDAPGLFNVDGLTSPDAALRMDYNAATHTLTYLFDADGAAGGYTWVTQGTANLASGPYNLKLRPTDTLTVLLVGSSEYQVVQPGQAYLTNLEITLADPPAASGPSGDYTVQMTDPGNFVWDLTGLDGDNSEYSMWVADEDVELELSFVRHLQQSGSGKVSGSGQGPVALHLWDGTETSLTFPGTYKVTGSITANHGLCKVRLTTSMKGVAPLEGANRTLSASENLSVTLDNATLGLSGTLQTKASASGLGSIKGNESVNEVIFQPGGGIWTLQLLDLLTTDKKVTGTAQVILHSGATHAFGLKGTYNAKTQATKLLLTGQGIAKGGNLVVTLGAANTVTSVKGKIFGQMVNATY